jgi:hypothetical protein
MTDQEIEDEWMRLHEVEAHEMLHARFLLSIGRDRRAHIMAVRMACGHYWKFACILVRRRGKDGSLRFAEIPP